MCLFLSTKKQHWRKIGYKLLFVAWDERAIAVAMDNLKHTREENRATNEMRTSCRIERKDDTVYVISLIIECNGDDVDEETSWELSISPNVLSLSTLDNNTNYFQFCLQKMCRRF
jgi:hypothetical protein